MARGDKLKADVKNVIDTKLDGVVVRYSCDPPIFSLPLYNTVTSGPVSFPSLPPINPTTEQFLKTANDEYLIDANNRVLYTSI